MRSSTSFNEKKTIDLMIEEIKVNDLKRLSVTAA